MPQLAFYFGVNVRIYVCVVGLGVGVTPGHLLMGDQLINVTLVQAAQLYVNVKEKVTPQIIASHHNGWRCIAKKNKLPGLGKMNAIY